MQWVDEKLQTLLNRLESEYYRKTPKSREAYTRAIKVFPGGVTYSIRYFTPYPLYIAKGYGTRVWDIDGNEYIDLWMGHGTHLLGHLPSVVVESVSNVLRDGTHYGFEHLYAVEYAEFLRKIIPGLELLRFTNSGGEANTYAIRLARAYTKKRYIVKMEGGWHGAVNNLHYAVSYPYTQPESAGYTDEAHKYTISIPFNNVDRLEEALKNYDVAAVILEPVMGAAGCINPEPGYLNEVRRLTLEYGSLLVFDEVLTGFRLSIGGAQEYFNVRADIVVLGKAIGGGLGSIGALGGREEIMDLLNHIKHPSVSERVVHAGTFVANPVVIRAGHALLEFLYLNKGIYEEANQKWQEIRERIDRICNDYDIPCYSTGEGTLTGIHFTRSRPRNAREAYEYRWSRLIERALNLYMRLSGVLYIGERIAHFLPALIHSSDELARFTDIFEDFLSLITGR